MSLKLRLGFPMNYMIWNSRCTSSKFFPSLVREIKNHYNMDFLALLDTRLDENKTQKIISQLGFQDHSFILVEGYSGGIWCLWNLRVR